MDTIIAPGPPHRKIHKDNVTNDLQMYVQDLPFAFPNPSPSSQVISGGTVDSTTTNPSTVPISSAPIITNGKRTISTGNLKTEIRPLSPPPLPSVPVTFSSVPSSLSIEPLDPLVPSSFPSTSSPSNKNDEKNTNLPLAHPTVPSSSSSSSSFVPSLLPGVSKEQSLWIEIDDLIAIIQKYRTGLVIPLSSSSSSSQSSLSSSSSAAYEQHTQRFFGILLERLNQLKETVLTIETFHNDERSQYHQQIQQYDAQLRRSKEDISAAWTEKWINRENYWRTIVNKLRSSLRSYETTEAVGITNPEHGTNGIPAATSSSLTMHHQELSQPIRLPPFEGTVLSSIHTPDSLTLPLFHTKEKTNRLLPYFTEHKVPDSPVTITPTKNNIHVNHNVSNPSTTTVVNTIDLETLMTTLQSSLALTKTLRAENTEAIQQVTNYSAKLTEYETETHRYQQTIDQLRQSIVNLQAELDQARKQKDLMELETEAAKVTAEGMTDIVNRLTKENEDYRQQLKDEQVAESSILAQNAQARQEADIASIGLLQLRGEVVRSIRYMENYLDQLRTSNVTTAPTNRTESSTTTPDSTSQVPTIETLTPQIVRDRTKQLIDTFMERTKIDSTNYQGLLRDYQQLQREAVSEVRRLRALYEASTGTSIPSLLTNLHSTTNAGGNGTILSRALAQTDGALLPPPSSSRTPILAGNKTTDTLNTAPLVPSHSLTTSILRLTGVPHETIRLLTNENYSTPIDTYTTTLQQQQQHLHQNIDITMEEYEILQKHALDSEIRIAELRTALSSAEDQVAKLTKRLDQSMKDLRIISNANGINIDKLLLNYDDASGTTTTNSNGSLSSSTVNVARTNFLASTTSSTPTTFTGAIPNQLAFENTFITPAQIALLVATVRADERECVLKDVATAAANAVSQGTLSSAADRLTALGAAAAASDREIQRLVQILTELSDEWCTKQGELEKEKRFYQDQQRILKEEKEKTVRQQEEYTAFQYVADKARKHAEEEIDRLRQGHQQTLKDKQQQYQLLEEALALTQSKYVQATEETQTLQAAIRALETDYAQQLRDTTKTVRQETEKVCEQRYREEVRGLSKKIQNQAEADYSVQLQQKLLDQKDHLRIQFQEELNLFRQEQEQLLLEERSAMEIEKSQAIRTAVTLTEENDRRIAEEARQELVQQHENEIRTIQLRTEEFIREVEKDAQERINTIEQALDVTKESALMYGKLLLQQIRYYKQLVRKEIQRRRHIHGKILDIQGNIRVHVRIRPNKEQIDRMLKAITDGHRTEDMIMKNLGVTLPTVSASGEGSTSNETNGNDEEYGYSIEDAVPAYVTDNTLMKDMNDQVDVPYYANKTIRHHAITTECVKALPEGQLVVYAPYGSSLGTDGQPVIPTSLFPPLVATPAHNNTTTTAKNIGENETDTDDIATTVATVVQQQGSKHGSYGIVPSSIYTNTSTDTPSIYAPHGTTMKPSTRHTIFEYEFDEVHGPYSTQETIFDYIRPLMHNALQGINSCIFAYGATGSGKTYTMEGPPLASPLSPSPTDTSHIGITLRSMKYLFRLAQDKCEHLGIENMFHPHGYQFSLSIMEIYQEKVRDLLAGAEYPKVPVSSFGNHTIGSNDDAHIKALLQQQHKTGTGKNSDTYWKHELRHNEYDDPTLSSYNADNLLVRETKDGVEVVNLTRVPLQSLEQTVELLRKGSDRRHKGHHLLNEHSSRSHMIVRLWIEGPVNTMVTNGPHATMITSNPSSPHAHRSTMFSSFVPDKRMMAVLHFVDLAGSERIFRTGTEGHQLKEASYINTSLTALGQCISNLRKQSSHIPYRDSKLTFVLKDSMGGSSKLLMFACISNDEQDLSESISTLNFASRCRATALGSTPKNIVMKPTVPVVVTATITSPPALEREKDSEETKNNGKNVTTTGKDINHIRTSLENRTHGFFGNNGSSSSNSGTSNGTFSGTKKPSSTTSPSARSPTVPRSSSSLTLPSKTVPPPKEVIHLKTLTKGYDNPPQSIYNDDRLPQETMEPIETMDKFTDRQGKDRIHASYIDQQEDIQYIRYQTKTEGKGSKTNHVNFGTTNGKEEENNDETNGMNGTNNYTLSDRYRTALESIFPSSGVKYDIEINNPLYPVKTMTMEKETKNLPTAVDNDNEEDNNDNIHAVGTFKGGMPIAMVTNTVTSTVPTNTVNTVAIVPPPLPSSSQASQLLFLKKKVSQTNSSSSSNSSSSNSTPSLGTTYTANTLTKALKAGTSSSNSGGGSINESGNSTTTKQRK